MLIYVRACVCLSVRFKFVYRVSTKKGTFTHYHSLVKVETWTKWCADRMGRGQNGTQPYRAPRGLKFG